MPGRESQFIAGPFCKGKAGSLFGDDHDERVFGQVVLIEQFKQSAALGIEVGDLSEVLGVFLPSIGSINKSRRQIQCGWIVGGSITFAIRRMWFVGTGE